MNYAIKMEWIIKAKSAISMELAIKIKLWQIYTSARAPHDSREGMSAECSGVAVLFNPRRFTSHAQKSAKLEDRNTQYRWKQNAKLKVGLLLLSQA